MEENKEEIKIPELSIESLSIAREKLKEKGEAHLRNFLNFCNQDNLYLNDIDKARECFESVEENIKFIDRIMEKL